MIAKHAECTESYKISRHEDAFNSSYLVLVTLVICKNILVFSLRIMHMYLPCLHTAIVPFIYVIGYDGRKEGTVFLPRFQQLGSYRDVIRARN